MSENIRLIIWDLDETLWCGTLTEGGIKEHISKNYEIIKELARRGIISSICSKNDFNQVKHILEDQDIWSYFVFPSIDWSPKGQRVAAIIDAMQLRPASVLFIDDNPMNRAEVAAAVDGVQVADENIIPNILLNPLFKGKNDDNLNRLNQYKLLEKRKADQLRSISSGISDTEFLRSSNIRVFINHHVENNLDRVIELINRTNQLNFTKKRLPEDVEQALNILKSEVNSYRSTFGLVRVVDNYGDHGYCGFYQLDNLSKKLIHFSFSCRILGMGVEAFIYQFLGCPQLKIVGEVLTNPINYPPVDWITISDNSNLEIENTNKIEIPVYLRGGCDLSAIGYYARFNFKNIIGEYNIYRNGVDVRVDHAIVAGYCLNGISDRELNSFKMLGYEEEDFKSKTLNAPPDSICILSFSPSGWLDIYINNITGALVPYHTKTSINKEQLLMLKQNYSFIGNKCDLNEFRRIIQMAFDRLSRCRYVFCILHSKVNGVFGSKYDNIILDCAKSRDNVHTLALSDFIINKDENDGSHIGRIVYFRAYQYILNFISKNNNFCNANLS